MAFSLAIGAGPAPLPADDPATEAPPERVDAAGVENLFRLAPNLYSGGEPQGAEGLESLRRLGVRTILSVDGATPDVEGARRLGMRYVHLPIGYDGIPRDQAIRIVEAVRTLPGPVFVHCHHGKHRGPAAAALCGLDGSGWSRDRAIDWMKAAGTSTDYAGLFSSVAQFSPPTPAERSAAASAPFPERATVPALVDTMVQIDATWDRLKLIEHSGFFPTPASPDLDPPHEALMLAEHAREALRQPETQARGADFVRRFQDFERLSTAFEADLRRLARGRDHSARDAAAERFRALGKSCIACHMVSRDR